MAEDNDNSRLVTREKLVEINQALMSNNHNEHCLLFNEMLMEIDKLRDVITEVREAMKHPEDAYDNAFSVFDMLTREMNEWDETHRVRIDV